MSALLSESRNFRDVDERVLTAGQPNEAQLADAARRGVQVVINLALHDDPRYSLADEAGCVRGLGMDYVHIPVQFNAPTEENLRTFISAMDAHKGKTILVHCAANYRVSSFMAVYGEMKLGWDRDKADAHARTLWPLNEVWAEFLARCRDEFLPSQD